MSQNKFQFADLLTHELVPNELRELLTAQDRRLAQLQQECDKRLKELATLERERQPRQAKYNQLEGDLATLTVQLNELKADLENVLEGNQELARKLEERKNQLEVAKSQEELDTNSYCAEMCHLEEEWTKLMSTWVTGKRRDKVAEGHSILRRNRDVNVKLHQRVQQLEQQIFGVSMIKSEK